MKEHRNCVQTLLQQTEFQQKILDEHNEVLSPSSSIVAGSAVQAKNHRSRSGSKILGASFSPGGLNLSGGNNGSSSVDRNLVVYTGQKMLTNRNILPKIIHELNCTTLSEYKTYVKDHSLKDKYYASHVNKIQVSRFPNPKTTQSGASSSQGRYKSPT